MLWRTARGSRSRTSATLSHPMAASLRALAGPTPQFSSGAIRTSQCARSASLLRSHTPSSGGQLLAMWLASFASVLVGPMPTQVGMPVQRSTVARMSQANSPPLVRAHVRQVEEALVDRVDLDLEAELPVDGVHPRTHVAVQGIVGREHPHPLARHRSRIRKNG